MKSRRITRVLGFLVTVFFITGTLCTDVHATIGGESMERQLRESMLRRYPHLKPEDVVCTGYFDSNGNRVTRDEFAILIAQDALDGASPEFRATHSVTSEGIIVNNATGLPDPVDARGVPITSSSTNSSNKEKVSVAFVDIYGAIIDTKLVTKGTDIAKNQFPKTTPPDIITAQGILTFDKWDYDGSVLQSDTIVKASYKVK